MNARVRVTSKIPGGNRRLAATNGQKLKLSSSTNSPVNQILHLQRTIGNRAAHRIFKSGSNPNKLRAMSMVHLSPGKPERSEFSLHGRIIPNSIKKQVKDKFPELHKLIENNPLDKSYVNAHAEKIGDIEHIWQISVILEAFPAQQMFTNAITRETESPQGKPHIHRIEIRCNTSRFAPIEETKKQYPDKREELAAIHAETLSHELIHAGVIIEKKIKELSGGKLPQSVKRIAQIVDFHEMLEVAHSSEVGEEKTSIVKLLRWMAYLSHLYKNPEEREKEVQKWFNWLIEEKYATQTSESAFSFPVSENRKIARTYSNTLLNSLNNRIEKAKRSGQKLFKDQSEENLCQKALVENKSFLEGDLRRLYDKIDAILKKRLAPSR